MVFVFQGLVDVSSVFSAFFLTRTSAQSGSSNKLSKFGTL